MEILGTRVRATGVIVTDSPGAEQLPEAGLKPASSDSRQTAYLY